MTATLVLPPIEQIADAIHCPVEQWPHRCHEISLAIVRSGILGVPCRVARGGCEGVGGQHSWVVIGDDCYHPDTIVDPTLQFNRDDVDGIYVGPPDTYGHRPHGSGSIWTYGQPPDPVDEVVPLGVELSPAAQAFMDLAAPNGLDYEGWSVLLHSPVEGWPAAEIIGAAAANPKLGPFIPIDIVGMLTDRNPGGLYLPGWVEVEADLNPYTACQPVDEWECQVCGCPLGHCLVPDYDTDTDRSTWHYVWTDDVDMVNPDPSRLRCEDCLPENDGPT